MDNLLMASVRQALQNNADSFDSEVVLSGEEGPESRGMDRLEYITTEDEMTADIGDLPGWDQACMGEGTAGHPA